MKLQNGHIHSLGKHRLNKYRMYSCHATLTCAFTISHDNICEHYEITFTSTMHPLCEENPNIKKMYYIHF